MVLKKFGFVLSAAILFIFWVGIAYTVQGQWGGFVYLFPKPGVVLSEMDKQKLSAHIQQASGTFTNDFTPEKGTVETIQFYKTVSYTLNGQLVSRMPIAMIRMESLSRQAIEKFIQEMSVGMEAYFETETQFGVTSQLNYTDSATLQRLKDLAPTRGAGRDQPNAVVLPLSKTAEWWGLPQEKREQYFFKHPEVFNPQHLGHNAIGFKYINKIFRKLYHSRFMGGDQDFITYFEFANSDAKSFDQLLDGLRDVALNPEWKFVIEKPLFQGRRVQSPEEIF